MWIGSGTGSHPPSIRFSLRPSTSARDLIAQELAEPTPRRRRPGTGRSGWGERRRDRHTRGLPAEQTTIRWRGQDRRSSRTGASPGPRGHRHAGALEVGGPGADDAPGLADRLRDERGIGKTADPHADSMPSSTRSTTRSSRMSSARTAAYLPTKSVITGATCMRPYITGAVTRSRPLGTARARTAPLRRRRRRPARAGTARSTRGPRR